MDIGNSEKQAPGSGLRAPGRLGFITPSPSTSSSKGEERPLKKSARPGSGTQGLTFRASCLPQGGFTLLEVMIALAVVAIALVTLLGAGSRSIDVHGRLQKITQATLLAQQRMSEIEIQAAGGSGLPLLEEEGVFEAPFEQFRWRVLYEDSPLPQLKIVTVTVAWGEERRNEMVDLNSFIIQ